MVERVLDGDLSERDCTMMGFGRLKFDVGYPVEDAFCGEGRGKDGGRGRGCRRWSWFCRLREGDERFNYLGIGRHGSGKS